RIRRFLRLICRLFGILRFGRFGNLVKTFGKLLFAGETLIGIGRFEPLHRLADRLGRLAKRLRGLSERLGGLLLIFLSLLHRGLRRCRQLSFGDFPLLRGGGLLLLGAAELIGGLGGLAGSLIESLSGLLGAGSGFILLQVAEGLPESFRLRREGFCVGI